MNSQNKAFVMDFCTRAGLSKKEIGSFIKNDICNPEQLLSLSEEDLKELGLNIGKRKNFIKEIALFQASEIIVKALKTEGFEASDEEIFSFAYYLLRVDVEKDRFFFWF